MSKNCVLIIGKTGAGKSTLGNIFLNKAKFEIGQNIVSCTHSPDQDQSELLKARIVDTIGFGDVRDTGEALTDSEVLVSTMKYIYEQDLSIICIVLCAEPPNKARKEQYLDMVLKYMRVQFPDCLNIISLHFKNEDITPEDCPTKQQKFKDSFKNHNIDSNLSGKLYEEGKRFDEYYKINSRFYFSFKQSEDPEIKNQIISFINTDFKDPITPAKNRMVCVKCKRHGDEVWMIKDKCKQHTFKSAHKERVDCHVGKKVPAHRLERRNSIFDKFSSMDDFVKYAFQLHKIIQYLFYLLGMLFLAYVFNQLWTLLIGGFTVLQFQGMVTGTYRCCNGKESDYCDAKWKCCGLFVSDIEKSKSSDKDFNEQCGMKCTGCGLSKYYKLMSKFEESGCGFKCSNERCGIFVLNDEFDLANLNSTGCIEEKQHVLMKEDSFNSVKSKTKQSAQLVQEK